MCTGLCHMCYMAAATAVTCDRWCTHLRCDSFLEQIGSTLDPSLSLSHL